MQDLAARRRIAVLAGHRADPETARSMLVDPEPAVRAAALAALVRMGAATPDEVLAALGDADPDVRRRACGARPVGVDDLLAVLRADPEPMVVEAAAFALGELGEEAVAAVDGLVRVATDHDEPLCREAAVAALGAIGDPAGLPAILRATQDRPAIRRRAVIALAPFDRPEVDAALEAAKQDRDWQVRQAAEDLTD